jgi:hypothetical protein
MRFAPIALYATALAPLIGCSSPVPAAPDAAYTVNMSSAGGECNMMISTAMLGVVDNNAPTMRVTDQMMLMGGVAHVTCTVKTSASGSGLDVTGTAQSGYNSLAITVTDLSGSSTAMAPAAGSITFLSPATQQAFSGACNFFIDGKEAPPTAGKVWTSFTCNGISPGPENPPVSCPVNESYALFENCLSM